MKTLSICILIFTGFVSFIQAREPLKKIVVTNAAGRKAVCNDESPAIYYFRSGSGNGVKRWVILLPGGFFCNTPGCEGRSPSLMTSLDKPEFMKGAGGLISDSALQNPDFYNANHVRIIYCSSDLWSGNRTETGGSRVIQFRGRNIFRSVIKDLKNRTSGANLSAPGTEVLLVGWSAGGVGVMVHLDWLARQLPEAKVRGLNDAGWLPEQSKLIDPEFENEIAKGVLLWNGNPDASCLRANRSKKSRCYLSSAYRYLATPMFVQESQWDSIFVHSPSSAIEFAEAVQNSLIPVEAAFSPRTSTHVLCSYNAFTRLKVNGYPLAQLLGNWFFNRAGLVKVITQ
jgi:hypothetical protein